MNNRYKNFNKFIKLSSVKIGSKGEGKAVDSAHGPN